ncbi:uncharacterized protein [Onthophagus taurus]|uniref:uncharacterized protein n=1 Tax=Onthophagus taurus TaxID=166361 RepID=UPI000C20E9AE|nr:uncharacterized protein LOC111424380 [Onthophagus taurus]
MEDKEKNRSLAGNVAIGFFVLGMVCVCVAFGTPNWLVSDPRISGARLDRFGLWTHCFRSLGDPYDVYQRRFFVGCRWIYDPFTTGYDNLRGYLIPGFMVATQLFFTLCFISVLISTILILIYFLCCGPEQRRFIHLVRIISWLLFGGGLCGGIAVIVFVTTANRPGWMPGHDNNFFGWSFVLAAVGVVAILVSSILFFIDLHISERKKRALKESQAKFEMQAETKA